MSLFGLIVQGKKESVPLDSIGISGRIKGYVVCLETTLTYRNDSHDPLEVSFRFPVDEGMAVVGLEAKIAGRTIRGVVSAFLTFNITLNQCFCQLLPNEE